MTHQTTDTWNIVSLRNPDPLAGVVDACSKVGTIGIAQNGAVYRYTGVALTPWQLLFAPPGTGTTFAPVPMCESLNLAVLGSAVHYFHPTRAAECVSIGIALNGTTINSAVPVLVDLAIVGGAALGQVSLVNGTIAGQGSSVVVPGIAIPAGSAISATVSQQATVAAGSGSITLGLYLS